MLEEYDQITAFHYAAFRPALHLKILKEHLKEDDKTSQGLDVGSGTGQSSIALSHFCNKVIGIEPSKEMLAKSIEHPNVEYLHYDGGKINLPNDSFDIIAFAGSLYYAKSQHLLDEVIRVGKNNSKVIIYDFDILLDSILEKLNVDITLRPISHYDHQVDFSGLKLNNIKLENKIRKSVTLEIAIKNVGHLLLSSKDNFELLSNAFGDKNIYQRILEELNSNFKSKFVILKADTYATVYQSHE